MSTPAPFYDRLLLPESKSGQRTYIENLFYRLFDACGPEVHFEQMMFLWSRFELLDQGARYRVIRAAILRSVRTQQPLPAFVEAWVLEALPARMPKVAWKKSRDQGRVLKLLMDGKALTQAAKEAGVKRQTVENWCKRDPEFAREFDLCSRLWPS